MELTAYNYQFTKIVTQDKEQQSIEFPDGIEGVDAEVSFENRQDIIGDLFMQHTAGEQFFWVGDRNKRYKVMLLIDGREKQDVFFLLFCNNRKRQCEDCNVFYKVEDFPGCVVIIDNRPKKQALFIQQNNAFPDTKSVARALRFVFHGLLKPFGLDIRIDAMFKVSEFWDMVRLTPSGFKTIEFRYPFLNLARLSDIAGEFITGARKELNSSMVVTHCAEPGGKLTINRKDHLTERQVAAAASSGEPIKMVPFGKNRAIVCGGKTYVVMELSDQIEHINSNDILCADSIDEVKKEMNNIYRTYLDEAQ
jgi:hypothetical protein